MTWMIRGLAFSLSMGIAVTAFAQDWTTRDPSPRTESARDVARGPQHPGESRRTVRKARRSGRVHQRSLHRTARRRENVYDNYNSPDET